MKQNNALILYYLIFGSKPWSTPEEIIAAQNAHPDFSGEEILVTMLKARIKEARTSSEKLLFYHYLLPFCHDEESRNALNDAIQALISTVDREFKRQQSRALRKSVAAFGMTVEELSDLHERTRRKLAEESRKRDASYDFASDSEIMARLNALDDWRKAEFYRVMERHQKSRRDDDILSLEDYAYLTLEALEQSAQ